MQPPHPAPQSYPSPQGPAQPSAAPEGEKREMPRLIRGAIYIAIAALLLAAIVCVIWVFIPNQGGIIAKAMLTILLLAGFCGAVLLDANLAGGRPPWLVLVSIATWVVALLVGAFKIWAPPEDDSFGWVTIRVVQLACVVGLLQLGLLHQRLYWKAHERYVTGFTRAIAIATTGFLAAMVLMLVFFLTFPDAFEYSEWYWRVVVALSILAAVGTLILPLLNALFAPRERRAARAAPAYGGAPQWPTFSDGVTPLPVLPDGTPDWEAFVTGVPSPGARMPQQYPGHAPQQPTPPPQPASPQSAPGPQPPHIPPAPPLPR